MIPCDKCRRPIKQVFLGSKKIWISMCEPCFVRIYGSWEEARQHMIAELIKASKRAEK